LFQSIINRITRAIQIVGYQGATSTIASVLCAIIFHFFSPCLKFFKVLRSPQGAGLLVIFNCFFLPTQTLGSGFLYLCIPQHHMLPGLASNY
jgi:putative flippase GtrA